MTSMNPTEKVLHCCKIKVQEKSNFAAGMQRIVGIFHRSDFTGLCQTFDSGAIGSLVVPYRSTLTSMLMTNRNTGSTACLWHQHTKYIAGAAVRACRNCLQDVGGNEAGNEVVECEGGVVAGEVQRGHAQAQQHGCNVRGRDRRLPDGVPFVVQQPALREREWY